MFTDPELVHFVLRVPLLTRAGRRTLFTIGAHTETAAQLGHVAIVKFGNPGQKARADRLKKQIETGKRTFLIMVAKQGNTYVASQAPLSSVHFGMRTASISAYMPPYYRDIGAEGGLWFIADSPFQVSSLEDFRLASNARPLLDVLVDCRTTSMLVCESDAPR